VNSGGPLSYHGTTPEDYQAAVLARASVGFIQEAVANQPQQPLLMFLTYGGADKPLINRADLAGIRRSERP
jgi:hypothetical protein